MKNIWIINHYAAINNGRHASLAKHFKEKGYESCVLLSSFDHSHREYLYGEAIKVVANHDGVNYVYVHSKPAYKNNGLGRILNMISFCWIIICNLKKICNQVGKPDYVIASSVHPFVWEIGYKIAKKYKCKFIAEIRDIWPLSLIEVTNISPSHPFVKLLGWVEKRAYLRADAIVSTMPFAYNHICDNFPVKRDKVHWMPNGIDVTQYEKNLLCDDTMPKELEDFFTNHWCCVYTGSFVASECIPLMLNAFEKLKNEDIYFAIIGDGHDAEALKAMKESLGLDKVKFFPFVKQSIIAKIMSKANCCIGAIHSLPLYRFGLSLNKLNDYLYSGKPVVFACDYHNVVNDAGQFSIPSDSATEMANTIMKIRNLSSDELEKLSIKSRKLIKETYDYDVVSTNYLALLESLN